MTRTRASAKKAGTDFETLMVDYFKRAWEPECERRRLSGAKDRGDLAFLKCRLGRVVVECKDYAGSVKVGPWLDEAETERGNDDAAIGVVVVKRARIGDPGQQLVMMTAATLVALVTGQQVDTDA